MCTDVGALGTPTYGGQRSTLFLRCCPIGFCFLHVFIVCVAVTCAIACVWESEDTLEEVGFSFHDVVPWIE